MVPYPFLILSIKVPKSRLGVTLALELFCVGMVSKQKIMIPWKTFTDNWLLLIDV